MGLIELIVLVAVIGFIVYIVTTYVPMPEMFKKAIWVICAIVVILFLLKAIGFTDVKIPHIN